MRIVVSLLRITYLISEEKQAASCQCVGCVRGGRPQKVTSSGVNLSQIPHIVRRTRG